MRRRSYLAAAGTALAALAAGCTAGDGIAATPSTTSTTTTQTTAAASVTVDGLILQPGAVQLETDYLTVDGGSQYLFVDARVAGESVDRTEVAVRLDGERHRPLDGLDAERLWRLYDENGWSPESGGPLAFELPKSVDSPDAEAVVEHPGGEHALDAGLRERLAATPSLTYEFAVPDQVRDHESVPVEVSVQNDGGTPARFLAGLNRIGPRVASIPVQALTPLVPAGERRVVEVSSNAPTKVDSENLGDGEWDVRFTLYTSDGSASRDVRVVDSA